MRLEPDPFTKKLKDFREKIDKDIVKFFVKKLIRINEVFKKQMVFVQALYKYYANFHKQNVPNYDLNDEMWLDTRNMKRNDPAKNYLINLMAFFITMIVSPIFTNWNYFIIGRYIRYFIPIF